MARSVATGAGTASLWSGFGIGVIYLVPSGPTETSSKTTFGRERESERKIRQHTINIEFSSDRERERARETNRRVKGRRDKRKRKHNHNSAGIDVVVRRQSLLFGSVSTPHLAHSYTGAMSMLHQYTHHRIERTIAYTTLAPAHILPTNPKNPFQTRGTVLLYVYVCVCTLVHTHNHPLTVGSVSFFCMFLFHPLHPTAMPHVLVAM